MTTQPSVAEVSKLRSAIQLNVILLLILAVAALVTPTALLRGFGIVDAPFAVLGLVRVFTVLALALGALVWSSRAWLASPSGVRGVRALAVTYGVGAVILGLQQWSVWCGRSGVALMYGCALLAISYGIVLRGRAENRARVA